jgi:hypothetical protein
VEVSSRRRFGISIMSSAALRSSARRNVAARGELAVRSGGENLSQDARARVGRAATFRIEAEALRDRAHASGEDVIKNQYLALADRWSTLAAHLEAELLNDIVV